MIGASLTLGTDPFLDALRSVDEAITGFRAKIVTLNQAFEGFHLVAEEISEQFEHLRESLDFGSHMADLSTQTGATAGEMAILTQAFENCGLGADGASGFTARLQKALSALNEAGTETGTAFRQLGVNVMAMRHMPLLDQINALQAAFRRISNVDDRTKIAEALFGRSGAEDIRFLVNVDGMSEARDQVGGLKESLDSNAKAFSSIAIALDALHLKAVQFWAGFAKALDGNTKQFANFLNRIDLTGIGEKLGEIARKVAAFIAELKPLIPLLEIFAARMVLGKIAGTAFAQAMVMNLSRPILAFQGLMIKLGEFKGAMETIRFAAFEANIGQLASAIGGLNVALIAAATAWAAWQAGSWIRELIWHDKAKQDSGDEQNAIVDQEGGVFNDFAARRKNLHTKEDRAALVASIDEAIAALRDRLSHEADRFSGQQLADVMKTGQIALSQLEKLGQQAAKAALTAAPGDPSLLAPWLVSGKTPVSNLGRAGGGLNMIGVGSTSSDPLLNETKRHTKLLENLLTAITGSPGASRPPVYHAT